MAVNSPTSSESDRDEQWQVADDEVVIVRATGSAGELVILKPEAGIRFPGISRDVHR